MRRYGFILGILFLLAFGVACDSEVDAGRATLPRGMYFHPIPDAEFGVYMYFHPAVPTNVTVTRFLPSDTIELPPGTPKTVLMSKASFMLGGPGQMTGTLEFATEKDAQIAYDLYQRTHMTAVSVAITEIDGSTVHLIRGDPAWVSSVLFSFRAETRAPLREINRRAWSLITNLPISVYEPPVAAGIIPIDGDLLQRLARTAGISVDGLETAYEMIRADTAAYAVYADVPRDIPSQFDAQFFSDTRTGIALVSGTNYPGVAVAFLVRSIAGRLGMNTIDIGNTNARYLKLEDAHLILKNKGSLIYATVSGTRLHAEELMLRALAE